MPQRRISLIIIITDITILLLLLLILRDGGGGVSGAFVGGGADPGLVGWLEGRSRCDNLGGSCPQGQVLVHHTLHLPPLALPLIIPSL